jgi:hypothetical protein
MASSMDLPAPDEIRRTAAKILSGPDFEIEKDRKVGDTVVDLMLDLIEWILAPFRWLFDEMEGLPDPLRWLIVVGLFFIACLLIGHIVYSLTATLRPIRRNSAILSQDFSNSRLSADEFERLAQQAFAERDYIVAVRFLFRASLTHLHDREGRILSPGLTNRQCLIRYRQAPFVVSLQAFVEVIDASWYGSKVCGQEDYHLCRDAYEQIRRQTKASFHANYA